MIPLLLASVIGQSCLAQQAVTYAQPVAYQQNYAAQTYAQPYAVFVAVENAETYYAGLVGSEVRAANRQQVAQQVQTTTDAKLDRLAQVVEQLQRQFAQQVAQPVAEPPLPQPRAAKPTPPTPSPGLHSYPISEAAPPPPLVSSAAASRTRSAAVAILTTSCAKCHTGPSSSGGLAIFDRPGQLAELDREQLDKISEQVWQGKMPRALPLPTEKQIVIRAWVAESTQAQTVALNPQRKPL